MPEFTRSYILTLSELIPSLISWWWNSWSFRVLFCKTWRSGGFPKPFIIRFSFPHFVCDEPLSVVEAIDLWQLHTLLFSPWLITPLWPQTGTDVFVAVLLPSSVFTLCGGSCNCLSLGSASSQQDNPVHGRQHATFCARGGGMGGLRQRGLQPPVSSHQCAA